MMEWIPDHPTIQRMERTGYPFIESEKPEENQQDDKEKENDDL